MAIRPLSLLLGGSITAGTEPTETWLPDESWALAPNYRRTKDTCQAAVAQVCAPKARKAELRSQKLKAFLADCLRGTVAPPVGHTVISVKKTDMQVESSASTTLHCLKQDTTADA